MSIRPTVSFTLILALISASSWACPLSKPTSWSRDVPPMPLSSIHGWFGSERLAAAIPNDGVWIGMGQEEQYADKFWWWRKGYSAFDEAQPDLKISAVRLDGQDESVQIRTATNGRGVDGDWDAMLVGMYFPSPGCWKVQGIYKGVHELTLVLKVGKDDAEQAVDD